MEENKKAVSLFAASDIHNLHGSTRLREVLGLVRADAEAVQPEYFILGGDLVGGGKPVHMGGDPKDWTPEFSLAEIRSEIAAEYGDGITAYFTYGSHDCHEVNGNRDFLHGPADCGAFYLYGVSFAQMRYVTDDELGTGHGPDGDADSGTGTKAAEAFTEWADSLTDSKPVFVMSHLPMHVHRGDNRAAFLWAEALNRAARKRDVFVFFAHNHTTERKDVPAFGAKPENGKREYERSFYLRPAGGTMPVQGPEKECTFEIRNDFTYLNAGYILKGCGTLLTLSEPREDGSFSKLTIARYAADPEEKDFGSTGIASPYTCALR